MQLSVIGTGYLGAVHAACLAEIGHEVLGIDIKPEKVLALSNGRSGFHEPDLDRLLSGGVTSGRLRFSGSLSDAAQFAEVHFVCVGTPQLSGSLAVDTSCVNDVIEGLGPLLRKPCLVVGKSTVPVGTASTLATRLAALAPVGQLAELAWNPEFLREGIAVHDTLTPDRIVVGAASERAVEILRQVYSPLISAGIPYIPTDLATAELAKVAANAFLATKISFINAIADVCDAVGADVVALSHLLGHDSRIGAHGMTAGVGFGGSCLPKDLRGLLARGDELGVADSLAFLREVDAVNTGRRDRAVRIAAELAGGSLAGRDVTVLGAAFKPHTDDVRDSPALAVASAISLAGARVRVHDPVAIENARASHPDLGYTTDLAEACAGAEILLHLTEWPDYRELDPFALRDTVRQPCLLDGRNVLPLDKWAAAGWTACGLGSRAGNPHPGRVLSADPA